MNSLNKVMLIGKVATEPRMKITKSGQRIVTFKLITSSGWLDTKSNEWQTRPEWHSIVAFGKVADKAQDRLKKDTLLYLEGAIQTRKIPVISPTGEDLFKQVTEIRASDIMCLNQNESVSAEVIPDNIGNLYTFDDESEEEE